jgi:hypothetical protein
LSDMGLVQPKALVPFGSYRKSSFAGHQSTSEFTIDGGRMQPPALHVRPLNSPKHNDAVG